MTPGRKRRLTYITIGVFFLLGGVEYAVILPTLWLYLDTRFDAPTYFLGFVLSAFCVADLLAGPQLGRWSDRSRNTKLVLLVANLPQIVGCLMYFVGLSPWMLVAGRFVAGLGSGVSSALFADIARVTSASERTAVLSIFMSVRQIGLLVGPGCNLFLRQLNFFIGPFPVDKYTSPGLFMAVCWTLHELLTLVMYWNLPGLHLQEQLESMEEAENTPVQPPLVNVSEAQPALVEVDIVSQDCAISPAAILIPQEPPVHVTSFGAKHHTSHRRTTSSDHHHLDVSEDTSSVTMSNEFIEEAEGLMHAVDSSSPVAAPEIDSTSVLDAETVQNLSWPRDVAVLSSPQIQRASSDSFLQRRSRQTFYGLVRCEDSVLPTQTDGVVTGVFDARVPQILREVSLSVPEPELTSYSLTWQYYCDEFVREEVIAILGIVFVAFFNQVSLEDIVKQYGNICDVGTDYGDSIDVSVASLGNGLVSRLRPEIFEAIAKARQLAFKAKITATIVILVVVAILWLSRRLSDRVLVLAGLFLQSATIAFLLWFIPQATDDNVNINLLFLLLSIFVDLLGIPLVSVVSNSLYSKITQKETQGLAQGIRRIFGQFGMILGPLWAGSMLPQPYIMFSVMLAVNLLLAVPMLLSFRRLQPVEETSLKQARTPHCSGERTPLLS